MIKKILIFLAGFGIGGGGGYLLASKILDKKYSKEMMEMINKINEEKTAMKAELTTNKPDISTFKKTAEKAAEEILETVAKMSEEEVQETAQEIISGKNVSESKPKKKSPAKPKKQKPTVYKITEDDFNDPDNREKVLLSYYSDGVLANSYTDKQVDISATIGYEMLDLLGEEKLDSLHVRNDAQNTDYEITRDFRAFSDIVDRYISEDSEY